MFSFCFKHEIKHFSLWFHSWDQFHRLRKKIFCKKTFFSLLFLNFSNCEDFFPSVSYSVKILPKKKKKILKMFLSSSFTQWRESFLLRGKKITYTWKTKIQIFYCFTQCHTWNKRWEIKWGFLKKNIFSLSYTRENSLMER